MLFFAAETNIFLLFAVKILFFALNHSNVQSSLGRATGRISICVCPPASLAPTTGNCD